MSTQVQYRRGTAAENDAFTGALAEITVDTTNSTLRVHDGVTPGGASLLTANSAVTLSNKTLENTTFTGTVTGNLIPSANITYDLGNADRYWNNLYLAGNTIYLGGLEIKDTGTGALAVFTDGGTTQAAIDVANIAQGNSVIGLTGIDGEAFVTVDGVANVLVITASNVDVTGAMSVTGNISGSYIFGNGSLLTGISVDSAAIQNGTASVQTFENADVAISAAGNSNVMIVSGTGVSVTGTLDTTGNVSAANVLTNISVANSFVGTLASTTQANITAVGTLTSLGVSGDVNITGNVTAGNVAGTLLTASQTNITAVGILSSLAVTGNVTAGNVITDTVLSTTGDVTVTSAAGNASIFLTPTGTGVIDAGTFAVRSSYVPQASTDLTNKQYVDEVAEGLKVSPAAHAATTVDLTATYYNGANNDGIGATLTSTSNVAFPTIDGVDDWSLIPPTNGVLVKNQTNAYENGRYNVTQLGNVSAPWILTRCIYCDESDEIPGSYVFVTDGDLYAGTGWVALVDDPSTFQVGVGNITYVQFSGAGTYSAGNGLTLDGTEFSVNSSQPQITQVGTLTNLSVTGNVTGGNLGTAGQVTATGNITGGNLRTASVVIGDGPISGVTTFSATGNANVGNIGAATGAFTTISGTLSTAAQTNITSLGTLTSLTVTGNVQGGNLTTTGAVTGNGRALTSLSASNIDTGTLAQARLANASLTVNGTAITLGGSGTVTANTPNSVTFNNSGTGAASGQTFNGSAAVTVSHNTLGAAPAAGSTNITSVGTVTVGTWQANLISTTYTAAKVTSVNGSTGAVSGLAVTSGTLGQFASTTSAALAGVISDETGTGSLVFANSPTLVSPALGTPASGTLTNCTVDGTDAVGFRNVPINSQSTNYTTVATDSGKTILHPSTDNNARTFTIPANSSVSYALGTVLTFVNMANTLTIAINSDTLFLANDGSTGSRTLAAYGVATAVKLTSTTWLISGPGLT